MKKLYLFMASLLAFGSVWAQGTVPVEGKTYFLKNENQNMYASSTETGHFALVDAARLTSDDAKFIFEKADENTYYIKNGAGKYINDVVKDDPVNLVDSKDEAQKWYLIAATGGDKDPLGTYAISKTSDGVSTGDCWAWLFWLKGDEGYDYEAIGYWDNGGASWWYLEEQKETEPETPKSGLYRLVCTGRGGYAVMGAAVSHYTHTWENETASRTIWNIEFQANGTCTMQNYLTGEYLNGAEWEKTMQKAPYSFNYTSLADGKMTFDSNGEYKYIHMGGDGRIVEWTKDDAASQWSLVAVSDEDVTAANEAEKTMAQAEVTPFLNSVAALFGLAEDTYTANSLSDYLIPVQVYAKASQKIYRIHNTDKSNYLTFTDNDLYFGEENVSDMNQLWSVVPAEDGFKLLNLNLNKYADNLGNADAGQRTAFVDNADVAGVYDMMKLDGSQYVMGTEFYLRNNGHILRKENDSKVNYWGTEKNKMTLELVNDVDINLNDGGDGKSYATAYLPFAVSGVTGAKVYTAEAPADGKMQLTEASNGVAANTGIVLIGDAAGAATLTIGEGTATESALQGTTVAKSVEANSVLTLGKSGENVGFFTYTGTGLRANSAYLEAATGATALVFSFGDDTDAIESIEAATVKDTRMFDLSGRRVSKAGKGIYIVNGNKIIK